MEYAQFRGFIADPTNIAHPRGKPISERMIPYVRDNFFRGEKFIGIDDYNSRAIAWCTNTAGTRIHGTTQKVPILKYFLKKIKDLGKKLSRMILPETNYNIY
jgi:transposase